MGVGYTQDKISTLSVGYTQDKVSTLGVCYTQDKISTLSVGYRIRFSQKVWVTHMIRSPH